MRRKEYKHTEEVRKIMYKSRTKHGLSNSPEWGTWRGIKDRCYNENCKLYKTWGGIGIIVCDRWLEKENGFMNFYEDMGEKPEPKRRYTINRTDPLGNYEPDNCFWAAR